MALKENQSQIDRLIETTSLGGASGALLAMLNEKATELKRERERLRSEHRRLCESLVPLNQEFVARDFGKILTNFHELARVAQREREELQRMIRLMVRRMQ
jgi:hypothetical protein